MNEWVVFSAWRKNWSEAPTQNSVKTAGIMLHEKEMTTKTSHHLSPAFTFMDGCVEDVFAKSVIPLTLT